MKLRPNKYALIRYKQRNMSSNVMYKRSIFSFLEESEPLRVLAHWEKDELSRDTWVFYICMVKRHLITKNT